VRAHKLALQAQRRFWQVLLHDTVQFRSLQAVFRRMSEAERQASAVYRRVLERYPTNGQLLKIYGRFVEYVKVCGLLFGGWVFRGLGWSGVIAVLRVLCCTAPDAVNTLQMHSLHRPYPQRRPLSTTTTIATTTNLQNEPGIANRYYLEAMKQGTSESLLALITGGQMDRQQESAAKVRLSRL